MTLSVFGVRHHGTGCSRALVSALEAFKPDLLLVEGPPEGTAALKVDGLTEAKPPVALIVYPEADPKRAGIYPFAEFSPEWVAIRYALGTGIPVEFIDLPLANRFGLEDGRTRTLEEVGKEFNVTRERIRQIEAKALRKLRHPSRSKRLRDFLD